jgi:hypothetical protein
MKLEKDPNGVAIPPVLPFVLPLVVLGESFKNP